MLYRILILSRKTTMIFRDKINDGMGNIIALQCKIILRLFQSRHCIKQVLVTSDLMVTHRFS